MELTVAIMHWQAKQNKAQQTVDGGLIHVLASLSTNKIANSVTVKARSYSRNSVLYLLTVLLTLLLTGDL